MAESPDKRSKYFIVALIIFLLVSPVILLVIFGMGLTSGEEFSPDDFSRRSFSYNRLPYFKWTIIGKRYNDITPAVEQVMLADGLIPAVQNSPKVWHLVSDSGSDVGQYESFECDARFLINYLDLVDGDGNSYWESWNEQFPKTAKRFWPVVADLARDQMYLVIPEIMRTAMSVTSDDVEPFEERLVMDLANAYLKLGIADQELERFERAAARLGRSIELLPSREAHLRRAEVYESLGKPEQAKLDRAKVNNFSAERVD